MTSQVVINDVIPRTQIVASSGQLVFNTNWTADATTDVLVYARASGIPANDETQLVSSGDYTVAFIGSSETVRVTFNAPRTMGDIITISRDTPASRTNLYTNTNFTPSMLNQDFGVLTLVDQQEQMYDYVVNPGYNVSATIEDIVDTVLPVLAENQIWVMGPGRSGFIAYDVPESGGLAPNDATYILQTADSELPNSQAMGSLASGIVVNTMTTGVQLTRVLTPVANQTTIDNGNGIVGNPKIGLADNTQIPGTEGFVPPVGTTAERPVSPIDGQTRFNTDLQALEFYGAGTWSPTSGGVVDSVVGTVNEIDVDNTDPINPVLSLSSTLNVPGTFNIQGTNAIAGIINDPTMASASSSNISTSSAIKTYIDSLVTGLNIQGSCVCATTTALTVVYNNGSSGVGATLTNAGAQAVLTLDGVSPSVGQRVLVKNQSSSSQNGIYTVTNVGSVSTNWVMTRATDYDTAAEIQKGDLVILTGGTTQSESSWVQTATVVTVGTDPITFVQFTASLPVNVASGGTGLTSLTPYTLLAGGTSSTGAMQQISAGTLGQVLQSNGPSAIPSFVNLSTLGVTSITGTANQVIASASTGAVTLSLPQDIATTSSPTFNLANVNAIYMRGNGSQIFSNDTYTALGIYNSGFTSVNFWGISGSPTGSPPILQCFGTDTNVTGTLNGKGTGGVQVQGTGTNNNAVTGYVGELISSVIESGSAVSLTSNIAANLTSISLTAGDWDVNANIAMIVSAGATILANWTSSSSATIPSANLVGQIQTVAANGVGSSGLICPTRRYSLASTTTIYLTGYALFGSGTVTMTGGIYARRRR
jgi:hypothetical protein